jgi:hypothetical protein
LRRSSFNVRLHGVHLQPVLHCHDGGEQHHDRLGLGRARVPTKRVPDLVEKELLEDEPAA